MHVVGQITLITFFYYLKLSEKIFLAPGVFWKEKAIFMSLLESEILDVPAFCFF
jgi:hypothetical protein